MRKINKIVVYYDDNTYEEVNNTWLNFTPPQLGIPTNPKACMICGDPIGHGNMPCPNMVTSTCKSEA